ncbi:Druantia anti-phage system protein DruA [Clostridium sp.]|uniref:Druantia anti-phage system protein DruA n=1 Tax=Clostridium sp. TaxID=1506 RepID=UPI003D6C9AAE
MDKIIMASSGRNFTSEDIELIKWTRNKYSHLSRRELAGTVCEFLNWTTPAGRAKTPQCVAFLVKLEESGIIELPPVIIKSKKVSVSIIPDFDIDITPIIGDLKDFEPINLEIARAGGQLKLWRKYVNDYHMLGDKQVFGSRLYYFVKSGDKKLGCLQFSASAWALKSRDEWIGWSIEDKNVRLHFILNNSRFLIFPWVNIKNLASKALALSIRQIQKDWLREYCYSPVLLETFVDTSQFAGTCYKASNWTYIGHTKGRGRMDKNTEMLLPPKAIYMYPLQKDFKDCLKGLKPCKVVNPDE